MRPRTVVCPCVDVSVEDVRAAIGEGSHDIRDLRMASGAGSGLCQGRYCLAHVLRILAETLATPIERVGMPTMRAPLADAPLEALHDGS